MDPKLQKFISILLLFLIATSFVQATYDWLVADISMNTNPVFQTAILYCIAGMLLNQQPSKKKSEDSETVNQ